MSSLLCSLSLWDCGPQWQSIYTVLIIVQYFTMALWTAVAVPLMSSLLYGILSHSISLRDCGPRWQSIYTVLIIIKYFTVALRTTVAVSLMSSLLYRHQEFQFPLWYAAHLGTESEHQVLNDSHIFVSFMQILLLFGTKLQYSHKRRQDEEENNPIRLPLETWCSLSVPQCIASNKGNWNSWCLYTVFYCETANCGGSLHYSL